MPPYVHKTKNIDIGLSVLCAVRRDNETLSVADIADVCECSVQTIKGIMHRAIHKLRYDAQSHRISDYK